MVCPKVFDVQIRNSEKIRILGSVIIKMLALNIIKFK
jgi:hypothetical protein